jgi:hypothetical protein
MSEHRDQAIRERAYTIWEQHGRPEGRTLEHWSQAEAEIGAEQMIFAAMEKPRPITSPRARGADKPRAQRVSAVRERRANREN